MIFTFLHLSDFHLKNEGDTNVFQVGKLVDALMSKGKFDKLFIIISGDIAQSGETFQYKAANSLIGRIINLLKKYTGNSNGLYEVLSVPGNHDVLHSEPVRNHIELKQIYSDNSYENYLSEELKKQESFFNVFINNTKKNHG